MRKIYHFSVGAVFALSLLVGVSAYAAENDAVPTVKESSVSSAPAENEPTVSGGLAGHQSVGKAHIQKRMMALDRFAKKLKKQRHSDDLKKELEGEVTRLKAALEDLKKKLADTTSEADAKALLTSLYKDHRIMAIALPRLEGMAAVGTMRMQYDALQAHTAKREAAVFEMEKSGTDLTKHRNLLASAKEHMAKADTAYNAAMDGFRALKPGDYPAKETLKKFRTSLKDGNKELRLARNSMMQLQALMKNKGKKSARAVMKNVEKEERKSAMMEKKEEMKEKRQEMKEERKEMKEEKKEMKQEQKEEKKEETQVKKEEARVTYTSNGFAPSSVTVKKGEAVTFVNESDEAMWVASAFHPSHTVYPEFDQKASVNKGGTYSFAFDKVGTWKYHNHLNPSKFGSVTVTE